MLIREGQVHQQFLLLVVTFYLPRVSKTKVKKITANFILQNIEKQITCIPSESTAEEVSLEW